MYSRTASDREVVVSIQLIAPASGAGGVLAPNGFIYGIPVSIQLIAPASGAFYYCRVYYYRESYGFPFN